MKLPLFILILSTCVFNESCKNISNMRPKHTIQNVSLEEIENEDSIPAVPIKSSFKTLDDWLFAICDSEKPEKSIDQYCMGLIEADHERVLFLFGINRDNIKISVDFKPANMYFLIPNEEFKNLNKDQLISELTTKLIEFTNTEKFKSSFLAESNSITFNDSVVIWSNK